MRNLEYLKKEAGAQLTKATAGLIQADVVLKEMEATKLREKIQALIQSVEKLHKDLQA